MMTDRERISALEWLGYSESESAFLCLAALHSGYFLRRQYSQFINQGRGHADDRLASKLLARQHATEIPTGGRTLLYHICSCTFYAAIGQPDSRNRRARPPFAIKTKLMTLDFVLANRGYRYFATEEEKVQFFVTECRVPYQCLPAKVYTSRTTRSVTERCFVEKFPIFVSSEPGPDSPVVSFCYVDEDSISTPAFQTWLMQYGKLFEFLRRFRIVYISTREDHFPAAHRTYERFLSHRTKAPDRNRVLVQMLVEYFELERLFRTGGWSGLDAAKSEKLTALRKEFRGDRYERLFAVWQTQGTEAIEREFFPESALQTRVDGRLQTCRIPFDYDLFNPPNRRRDAS